MNVALPENMEVFSISKLILNQQNEQKLSELLCAQWVVILGPKPNSFSTGAGFKVYMVFCSISFKLVCINLQGDIVP